MTDLQSSLDETVLRCPLCTKAYTKPKCLPCLHTFCEQCLHSYITDLNWLADKILCPVCRDPTPAPVADINFDTWAEHFPTNHLIVSIQDALNMRQGGKECYPCAKANKNEVAVGWCQTCVECLCQSCSNYHQRFKATSNHSIISMDEMNKQPINVTSLPDKCPDHHDDIKMYCVDHTVHCCSTCVAVTHRKCEDVKTIHDLASQIRTNNEHTDLIKTFGLYIDHANVLVSHCCQVIQKLPSHKDETVKEIRSIREKMNILLMDMEQKVTDELDSLHEETVSTVESEKDDCNSLREAMTNSLILLQTTIDHGSESQLFQTVKKLKEKCRQFREKLLNEQKSVRDVKYAFLKHKLIDDLIPSLSEVAHVKLVTSLAQLPVCPEPDYLPSYPGPSQSPGLKSELDHTPPQLPVCPEPDYLPSYSGSSLSPDSKSERDHTPPQLPVCPEPDHSGPSLCPGLKSELDHTPPRLLTCPGGKPLAALETDSISTFSGFTMEDGQNCLLTDISFTRDSRIILADYANRSLKLFSEDGYYLSQLSLKSGPWGVTAIDRGRLAVALPHEKRITLVCIVRDELTITDTIKVSMKVHNVTYVDSRLFVTCQSFCVKILSMDGKKIGEITKDTEGTRLFKNALCITSKTGRSPDQSRLYVSDHTKHQVLCLTLDGRCEWTYSDKELKSPAGIAVDNDGNVYVCGCNSKNVHMVSADGKKIKVFLDATISGTRPYSLSFNKDQTKLLIANYDDGIVTIYHLVRDNESGFAQTKLSPD